jgi:hypothetical protein
MSTRWLMGVVLAVGLFVGLGLPAAEVYKGRTPHGHLFVEILSDGPYLEQEDDIKTPFWPSYWLRLHGKPWKCEPICGSGSGRLDETCEIENLGIFEPGCFSPARIAIAPKSMLDKYPGLR